VCERIQKIATLKQLQIHFETKCEKGVGMPFPPHYTPEPCTLACRRSTFYQHSQFFKRPLVQRKTKTRKKQATKFEHKLSQKLQF